MNFNIHNSQGNLQFKEIQTSEETKHYEGLYVYKNKYLYAVGNFSIKQTSLIIYHQYCWLLTLLAVILFVILFDPLHHFWTQVWTSETPPTPLPFKDQSRLLLNPSLTVICYIVRSMSIVDSTRLSWLLECEVYQWVRQGVCGCEDWLTFALISTHDTPTQILHTH